MTRQDEAIRRRLVAELDFDPRLDAVHVTVAVRDGVAVLTGRVASLAQREAARAVAARVKGVRAVAQELEVAPPACAEADAVLAGRVADSLAWASTVPQGAVAAEVSAGVVTLRGEVGWDFERRAAEAVVGGLSGVVGVINLVKLKARPRPADVRTRIEAALARHGFRARDVRVSARGGLVTLAGNVLSLLDKEAAERTAWSVPGVGGVLNQLVVTGGAEEESGV